jgi:class 3 adenylate cyclase
VAVNCSICGHENREGAKFCEECAAPLRAQAEHDPRAPAPEVERRQLTFMFCDLVGSTRLSEGSHPEDFGQIVEAYQGACRQGVEAWDGFVSRAFGDGLLIYFGYPKAHEDAPARAVRAGLAIVDATPQFPRSEPSRSTWWWARSLLLEGKIRLVVAVATLERIVFVRSGSVSRLQSSLIGAIQRLPLKLDREAA